MRQRKVITLLVIAGVVMSLTSCGDVQSSTTERVGEENTEESSKGQSTADSNVETMHFVSEGKIEETVMVDESDIKITATELSYTDYDIRLNLTIENNSDKDLSFTSGSMGYGCNAINGYMIQGGYMNADVSAGKNTNETIRFNLDELSVYGITKIADIQVGFRITDDSYDVIYQGKGKVKTSLEASYNYKVDTFAENLKSKAIEKLTGCSVNYYSDENLYDQSGVKIVSEALITNKDGEQVILIEIENDSSELVYCTTIDIALNKMIVYSALWTSDAVAPHTRCVASLSPLSLLDERYWELFGISEIGEISFTFAGTDGAWTEVTSPQEISIALKKKVSPVNNKGDEVYNENGIRIISKGLMEDTSEYSEDINMLFLVENNSAQIIEIDDSFDSLSVNGYMVDYMIGSREIPAGKCALVDVEIDDSSLQDSGIAGITGIAETEMTFEIRDGNYNVIAEPTVLVKY